MTNEKIHKIFEKNNLELVDGTKKRDNNGLISLAMTIREPESEATSYFNAETSNKNMKKLTLVDENQLISAVD